MPGIERKDLIPLSDAWFLNRNKKGIMTASNVGSYVGINSEDNEFKNISDNRKRGEMQILKNYKMLKNPKDTDFTGNWFTRRGNFYEPVCNKVFEASMNIPVKNCVMWQSTTHDYLFATPDGLIDDKIGWEVKNPWKKMHDNPPPHYIAQIQLQLYCTNRTKQYFMSQCIDLDCAKIWLVEYSEEYMKWLLKQLEYLHDCVEKDVSPDCLNLEIFDLTPPKVPYVFVKEIESLIDLVGDIEEFEEEPPANLSKVVKSRKENLLIKKRKRFLEECASDMNDEEYMVETKEHKCISEREARKERDVLLENIESSAKNSDDNNDESKNEDNRDDLQL